MIRQDSVDEKLYRIAPLSKSTQSHQGSAKLIYGLSRRSHNLNPDFFFCFGVRSLYTFCEEGLNWLVFGLQRRWLRAVEAAQLALPHQRGQ
ncbi:hypothetical protein NDU88_007733 [Pleurodeles waltl]|uniref:Uncharacterized protein n=1 Tax=Pleurodeles waltl TaxID=8319 RepID=A0AAV7N4A8_PLEWA|nr:hypothetical protein NDU88_007733 [Pleurodeles waltl]